MVGGRAITRVNLVAGDINGSENRSYRKKLWVKYVDARFNLNLIFYQSVSQSVQSVAPPLYFLLRKFSLVIFLHKE